MGMSPGDESGGEDDEDGDEESPPKKRAKAKPWARGTGVRGGAGAYGGLSMLERDDARNKRKKANRALAKAAREQAAREQAA